MCSRRFGTVARLADGAVTVPQFVQILGPSRTYQHGGEIVEKDVNEKPIAQQGEDHCQARAVVVPVECESDGMNGESNQADHTENGNDKETTHESCVTIRELQQWLHQDIHRIIQGELGMVEEGAEPVSESDFPGQVPEGGCYITTRHHCSDLLMRAKTGESVTRITFPYSEMGA